MGEAPVVEYDSTEAVPARRGNAAISLHALVRALWIRRRLVLSAMCTMVAACLLYWVVAPRQYEAEARLALRTSPASALNSGNSEFSGSLASGQLQLETLANVFRSDQLAWRVILSIQLYKQAAFAGNFAQKFPGFRPADPTADAQSWLLERFRDRVRVRTIPRTLLLEVRFRCRDAVLSATVVNALIQAYQSQETERRLSATADTTGWMAKQLSELKARSDADEQKLSRFQKEHAILIAPESLTNGRSGAAEHGGALTELDELERDLGSASAERILREAQFRAAEGGDPEQVLAEAPRGQGADESAGAVLRQIHTRQSELQQEQAQLSLEHGANYPRMVEIRKDLENLNEQVKTEDVRLLDRFRAGWQTALDREQMLRAALAQRTSETQNQNAAVTQFESMRREADASHELYIRMRDRVQEAGMFAGLPGSPLWEVDAPRAPARPVSPNLLLDLAVTLFVGGWLSIGMVLIAENLRPRKQTTLLMVAMITAMGLHASAQAPTPSTSGLPTGVAKIPGSPEGRIPANAKDAPAVWNGQLAAGLPTMALDLAGAMPAPIAPGDMVDVSEFHTPEFHSSVRVSQAGTVALPMVGEVNLGGLDEQAAARAIEAVLQSKGILLHPQVFVQVVAFVGQDVSVFGEVARPGVYPFGVHHRLLDVISEASGLTAAAGSVVSIVHRGAPEAPVMIALVSGDAAITPRSNPELLPGDMVRVSRTGLVYVLGDVLRPGGFTMEPGQGMTVLHALALAWGPSQNASLKRAVLIHEQNGGRTVTTLDLKRVLRGKDPDLSIGEHDILFIPDSAAKNLWNRTMESVVQSAAGVSIYAGMVYSQRF